MAQAGSSAIATDRSGNYYVGGTFSSSSITIGSTILINDTTNGSGDILIIKYDATGNVLWAKKSFGGTLEDYGTSIVADGEGNCYVTVSFYSDHIALGSVTLANYGSHEFDFFVSKFDSSGNVLWAKSIGGNYTDYGNGISLDGGGNCFVTGGFWSTRIGFGSDTLTNMGSWDVFVAKLGVAPKLGCDKPGNWSTAPCVHVELGRWFAK